MKKKARQSRKPTLNTAAVKDFAEGDSKPRYAHQKAQASNPPTIPVKSATKATSTDKFRLTMKIDKSVHLKLKLNAARQDITMTALIEKLVNEHLED